MLLTLVQIAYVLIAIAMVVLILLQRGAGAAAGSGFGAGASATVFGSRGSANFLSKSTAVLATLFFIISLGMAMYASRNANVAPSVDDLGVMGRLAPASEVPVANEPPATVPGATEVPATAADATDLPAAQAPVVEDAAAEGVESTKVEEKKEGE